MWKYNFTQFILHHPKILLVPESASVQTDPKQFFCFVVQAIPSSDEVHTEYEVVKELDDHFAVGESKLGGFPGTLLSYTPNNPGTRSSKRSRMAKRRTKLPGRS